MGKSQVGCSPPSVSTGAVAALASLCHSSLPFPKAGGEGAGWGAIAQVCGGIWGSCSPAQPWGLGCRDPLSFSQDPRCWCVTLPGA